MEFIKNNYIDFDIMCFTETHLDDNITLDSIPIPDRYDSPLRKDRTNHGGGILISILCNHREFYNRGCSCMVSDFVQTY